MDGASKFVKGDAIAAIVITLVNLIGGFGVGVGQKHLAFGDAHLAVQPASRSVTDWSSQIPALLLSVATGLIVTRSVGEGRHGLPTILEQLTSRRMPLRGGRVRRVVVVPESRACRLLPFIIAGGAMAAGQYFGSTRTLPRSPPKPRPWPRCRPPIHQKCSLRRSRWIRSAWNSPRTSSISSIPSAGGDLLERVKALRRKGRLRHRHRGPARCGPATNLDLPMRTYAIKLFGIEVARGRIAVRDCAGDRRLPGFVAG